MGKPDVKILTIQECKVVEKDGSVFLSGYANTKGTADRYGDIPTVLSDKRDFVYDLTEFKKNPVMLIDHENKTDHIAGSFTKLKEDDKGLFIEAKFSSSELPLIKHTRQIYKEGHAKALSIAGNFNFEDSDNPEHLTLAEIYEISLVAVPADPNSLAVAFEKAYKMISEDNAKGVVPFKNFPLASQERGWDSTAAIKRIRTFTDSVESPKAAYKNAFVWYDAADADNFGAYKLPIADIIGGKLTAIPRGIFSAAAALQGARGGVAISDADKARTHLGKYYKKLDMVAPWDKSMELESLKSLKEIEQILRDKGFSQNDAKAFISKVKEFSHRDGVDNNKQRDAVDFKKVESKIDDIILNLKIDKQLSKI